MILTLTLSSAVDKVIFIDEWTPGIPMRTEHVVMAVGGKGLDASVTLRCLDVETTALAFVAGKTGEELLRLAEAYGIVTEPVWVGGETRVAHVIVEKKHSRHNHVTTGQIQVRQEHVEVLLERLHALLPTASWVICAGSIPAVLDPSLYRQIIEESSNYGVPVLIDSSGPAMLAAVSARPAIFKLNWNEFEGTFNLEARSLDELKNKASQVYREHSLPALVITCAADGILAFSEQGFFHVQVPQQRATNAAGAGDAVSSALVWRLEAGDTWQEALHWAGAVSAAVVLTEATAECRMEDVRRLYQEVKVIQQ